MKIVYSLIIILFIVMGTTACHIAKMPPKPPTFRLDFGGMNGAFIDLRTGKPPVDMYTVGEAVLLRFMMQATDERNTFYLDDEEIVPSYYNDEYGYCLHFVMPAHDAKITWKSQNTMLYEE